MKIAAVAAFVVLTSSTVFSQNWSPDQLAVWKVVQDSWKAWQGGDANGIVANVHDQYQGWSDDIPLPTSKQELLAWYNSMKDNMKVARYEIQPARIVVTKTGAVVDYYYSMYVTWAMGVDVGAKEVKGRVAEFYVKEGDKWLLLGDMMVHQAGEDDGED
jgi:hypothetical protein